MKKIIAITVSLLVATAWVAQAADAKDNWEKHCAKCHGSDGKGDTKMGKKLKIRDYTDAKVQAEMKDDKMAEAIKEGVKEGSKKVMNGYSNKLSDDEVKALVTFIRGLKK